MRKEMDELQRIENQAWRHVLGGPSFTLVVAMQEEIGASTVKCRDIKNKLKMVKHVKNTKNRLLRAVVERMVQEGSGGWIKQVEECMCAVEVGHAELTAIKKEKINLKVNEWEERRWRIEVEQRETLEIYRAKNRIGEEGIYSNDGSSVTLFRCRTNTIKLNWRQRFQGGIVDYPVCESGAEKTMRHFLKECIGLGGIIEIHEVREEDKIEELLLFSDQGKKIGKRKKYLEDLWRDRTQHVQLRCEAGTLSGEL